MLPVRLWLLKMLKCQGGWFWLVPLAMAALQAGMSAARGDEGAEIGKNAGMGFLGGMAGGAAGGMMGGAAGGLGGAAAEGAGSILPSTGALSEIPGISSAMAGGGSSGLVGAAPSQVAGGSFLSQASPWVDTGSKLLGAGKTMADIFGEPESKQQGLPPAPTGSLQSGPSSRFQPKSQFQSAVKRKKYFPGYGA